MKFDLTKVSLLHFFKSNLLLSTLLANILGENCKIFLSFRRSLWHHCIQLGIHDIIFSISIHCLLQSHNSAWIFCSKHCPFISFQQNKNHTNYLHERQIRFYQFLLINFAGKKIVHLSNFGSKVLVLCFQSKSLKKPFSTYYWNKGTTATSDLWFLWHSCSDILNPNKIFDI